MSNLSAFSDTLSLVLHAIAKSRGISAMDRQSLVPWLPWCETGNLWDGSFCGITITNLGTQEIHRTIMEFGEKRWWQESLCRFSLSLQMQNAIFAWLEHLVTPWGDMRSNGPTEWRSTVDWDVVACECLLVPHWLRRLQRILSGTKCFLKLLTLQVIKGRPFQPGRNQIRTYHYS